MTNIKKIAEDIKSGAKGLKLSGVKTILAETLHPQYQYPELLLNLLSYEYIKKILLTNTEDATKKFKDMYDVLGISSVWRSTPNAPTLSAETFQGYSSFPLVEGLIVGVFAGSTAITSDASSVEGGVECLKDKFMLERVDDGFNIIYLKYGRLFNSKYNKLLNETEIEARDNAKEMGKYELTDRVIILTLLGTKKRKEILLEYKNHKNGLSFQAMKGVAPAGMKMSDY